MSHVYCPAEDRSMFTNVSTSPTPQLDHLYVAQEEQEEDVL